MTTSEARNISYYRRHKSGGLEKPEIGNGNDVVSRDCISATVSFVVTKFLLYTEYMFKTIFMAHFFSRYFVPERCVPKLTLLPVSCIYTYLHVYINIYNDCNSLCIIIVNLQ